VLGHDRRDVSYALVGSLGDAALGPRPATDSHETMGSIAWLVAPVNSGGARWTLHVGSKSVANA